MTRTKLGLFGNSAAASGARSGMASAPAARAVPDTMSGLTPIERAFADTLGTKAARA